MCVLIPNVFQKVSVNMIQTILGCVSKEQDFLSFKAGRYLNAAVFASQIFKMLYADHARALTVTNEAAVI